MKMGRGKMWRLPLRPQSRPMRQTRLREIRFVVIGVGLGWLLAGAQVAAETTAKSVKSSRASVATKKTTAYEGDLAPVLEKLDEVLESQEKINARFDAVMEELRIVKVRSLMGSSATGN